MVPDSITSWLADNPTVVAALFVGGIYVSKGLDLTIQGGGSAYTGP